MSRANRFYQPGMICHITHRCHNSAFLFRFARDRSEYRERLRKDCERFGVFLLNYCLTSTHIHEIAIESRNGAISRMMQALEGGFASFYNHRKERRGAFWEDRYHCTMVDDEDYLWNCLVYVDLNMVRAGVVAHPYDWSWCGYQELMGQRTHYRLLDIERLLGELSVPDFRSFQIEYRNRIEGAIADKKLKREKRWTESIAVGRKAFVENIAAKIRYGRRNRIIEKEDDGSWALWELPAEYQVLVSD